MLNYEIGQVYVEGIFNQIEDRLAPAFVTSDVDVRFQIWCLAMLAVRCLYMHSLKEELKVLLEACLDARTCMLNTAEPVAAG